MIHKSAVFALVIAVAGSVLSITLRDIWHPLGMLFYITPWLIRLVLAAFSISVLHRRKPLAVLGAACILLSTHQATLSFGLPANPPPTRSTALSVSIWNAARKLNAQPAQWENQAIADISALVETGAFTNDIFERFNLANPSHEWRRLDGGTMIGIRGKILSVDHIGVSGRYRCFRVIASVAGVENLPIYVVDIRSNVWISREPALREILKAAANDPNAIILGDFNTPVESRWLDPWREAGFSPVNESNHSGFRETWAFGVPLLTLDQIWIGKNWRSFSTSNSRPYGDHRKVESKVVRFQ